MGFRNKKSSLAAFCFAVFCLASAVLAVAPSGRVLLDSDDHIHVQGGNNGNPEVKGHPDGHDVSSESAAEHLVEVFGGEGVMYESELAMLFDKLNGECGAEGHDHGHSNHHHHGKETLTAEKLVEEFGHEKMLNPQELDEACSSILKCQLESGCELLSGEEHHEEESKDVAVLKLIIAIVFFFEALLGTVIVLVMGFSTNFRTAIGVMNSFAGGVFLATGFVHLLPHINETEAKISGLDDYPLGSLIIVIGFMTIFFVEHILFDVHSTVEAVFKEEGAPASNPQAPSLKVNWNGIRKPVILLAAISVHAVLEAIALGLEGDKTDVLLLFASIGSHKGAASLALSARFLQNGASKAQVLGFMGAFALIAPCGILIGWASDDVEPLVLLILNGLAAGTFIYVGAYEVIAEEFHHHKGRAELKLLKYLAVFVGAVMISLLQLVPHEDH